MRALRFAYALLSGVLVFECAGFATASADSSASSSVSPGATVSAGPAAVASAGPLTKEQMAQVDAFVAATLARDHVPGAAIAIARGGELLYARGYGLRDVAAKAPASGQTVFEIGSVTKQFTAAAVMLLVQAGKVRLDAPISTYLTGIPFGTKISVRQLLTHTSGLANYTDVPNFWATTTKPATPAMLVALIAKKPLDFLPGTKWEYSNTNYVVLGMLIEKKSGQTYPAFLKAHIFAPLALAQTRYSPSYLDDGDVALPYSVGITGAERLKPMNLDWAYSAGALWSNAPDLVRWEDALFSGRVVNAASLAAMTTPIVLTNGAPTMYGFGLFNSKLYGQQEIWHTGGLPGYASIDAYFPEQHLEVAVLGNAVSFDASPIVRDVLALMVPSVATAIAAEADATSAPGEDPAITKLATSLVDQAQNGKIDRTLFEAKMNAALTPDLVAQVAQQFAPLGKPKNIHFLAQQLVQGYHTYRYRVVWPAASVDEIIALDTDGKIAGWRFRPASDTPATASPSPAVPGPASTSTVSPAPGPTVH